MEKAYLITIILMFYYLFDIRTRRFSQRKERKRVKELSRIAPKITAFLWSTVLMIKKQIKPFSINYINLDNKEYLPWEL